MRYPKPLKAGSTVAVTAPSSGVEAGCQPRLDLVMEALRQRGFRVLEGECLRDDKGSVSAPAELRAAELMGFLLREDVDAVLPPWGGEFLIEILPLLDFESLAAVSPTWVMGYSDVSTLMLPLTLMTGTATAHGPNLMDLAPGQDDPLPRATLAHLQLAEGESFVQRSSERWQLEYEDFRENPAATFRLTEETRWLALDGRSDNSFAGRLIGGCLDTISRLAGSPYGDVPGFVKRCGDEGAILYFENCELQPRELVRALWNIRLARWFDGLAGVLIGRSTGPDPEHFGQHDALRQVLGDLDIPVLIDVDCGHRPPQMLFLNGALAQVRFSDGAAVVSQSLA